MAELDALPAVTFDPARRPADWNDPQYQRARTEGVAWCPDLEVVIVTSHDLVQHVLADPDTYSAHIAEPRIGGLAPACPADFPMLINADGDKHARMRTIFQRSLSATRVRSLQPLMRRRAVELVTALAKRGRAELRAQFADPYVANIVNDLWGFPAKDAGFIAECCRAVQSKWNPAAAQRDRVDAALRIHDFDAYVDRLIAARRAAPRDDLISDLARGLDDGQLTQDELRTLVRGFRSTAELTTLLLLLSTVDVMLRTDHWRLAEQTDPTHRQRIISRLIDEVLRLRTPQRAPRRITTRAVTLGGHAIRAGVPIMCLLEAASTGPTVLPDPDLVDLTRPSSQEHLAFGYGPHSCLGASAARAQVRVAIDALLRLPRMQLADPEHRDQVRSHYFSGPARLEVTWTVNGS